MYFTYLRRELRRRSRQAVVVALGLAIGIGLVVTVSAASAGVNHAQGSVLHSLYGVGTDMTVTKTASAGSGGPQHFGFAGGGGGGSRPAPGQHISRNTLHSADSDATFSAIDVTKVAGLKGTAAATGGLMLTDTSFSGTIPNFSGGGSGGGGYGGYGGGSSGGSSSSGASSSSFHSSFNISSSTVDGVQITDSGVGPLTASQVATGKYFSSSDNTAHVAIVGASYAKQHSLSVGSKVTVAGKKMSVIGVAQASSSAADIDIPLGTAQALSGLKGDVNTIFVSANSASNVSSLATAVKRALPGTTVSTSASLANEVTGSLSSASSLATNLGVWLSVVALVVAFVLAGLLMMSSVSRRVREFGTLKAIGWPTRRIVGQVMGEGVAVGILGAIGGVILGIVGAEVITAISPALKATVNPTTGFTGSGGASGGGFGGGFGGFRHAFGGDAHTVLVHLTAPLQSGTIALAIVLALAGGLIAASFGAWRAARLRPAAALRTVA